MAISETLLRDEPPVLFLVLGLLGQWQ